MTDQPRIMWWRPEETGVEVTTPALITAFGDGLCVVSAKIAEDGSTQLTWSITISAERTLPEVEHFLARVATFIIEEPVIPAADD